MHKILNEKFETKDSEHSGINAWELRVSTGLKPSSRNFRTLSSQQSSENSHPTRPYSCIKHSPILFYCCGTGNYCTLSPLVTFFNGFSDVYKTWWRESIHFLSKLIPKHLKLQVLRSETNSHPSQTLCPAILSELTVTRSVQSLLLWPWDTFMPVILGKTNRLSSLEL